MKPLIFAVNAVLALTACLHCRGADEFPIKVYMAYKAPGTIHLDGRLTEEAWEASPIVGGFTHYGKSETSRPQTFFRIVYSDQYLYLGVICDEPNMTQFMPVAQARDSMGVFHGETIEFFIDPAHSHTLYYQIAVNAAASIYDSQGQDPTWNADVRAAAAASETGWSLEIQIPWKDLGCRPEPGALLGFNVCRDRYIDGKQWTNWARVSTGFHDPIRFAHLVLSPNPEHIGTLGNELRKGDRTGPILIHGNEGISDTSYRALAKGAIKQLDDTLEELRLAAAKEASPGARTALTDLLAKYRKTVEPIRQNISTAEALDGQQWTRLELQLTDLQATLQDAVWQARLQALLDNL